MSDNVKIGTFMLKISRLLLLKDFGKKISVSKELDVFVKHRCLWPQQSPYEGKHSARHEYLPLMHFHNSHSVFIRPSSDGTYYYRNVFIIFSLHTEMDENRCTNGIIRVANYTTFVHRFSSISVCNKNIMKTFLII